MKLSTRDIESFELTSNYYEESFFCGNRTHVAEELAELMLFNFGFFQEILIGLPKDIQTFVLNHATYHKANLKMSMAMNRIQ